MEGVELDAPGGRTRADFGAFFAEHHRELGMLAYRICGDRQVAEDVTADAFAEAWRRWAEVSRSDSPAAEMRRILARYAQDRVRRADPNAPQDPYEPDITRIQALLFERIALIPQPRTMSALLGGGGVDHKRRRAAVSPYWFRRPGPVRIVIAANAAAAVIAIVVAVTTGGSSAAHSKSMPIAMATSSTTETARGSAPAHAGFATGTSASVSASPTASPSPTVNQPTNSASSSFAATTAAAVLGATTTTATTSSASASATTKYAKLLTASGTVNINSSTTWTELDVATDISHTLNSLTITFTVEPCPGLIAQGNWDDGAGGQFSETTTTNANGSITYVFVLTPGDEVGPGDVTFAAQFSHDVSGWNAGVDTYDVAAQSASSGAADDLGGSF